MTGQSEIEFPHWVPKGAIDAAHLMWKIDAGYLGPLCKRLTTDYRMEGVLVWLENNALDNFKIGADDPRGDLNLADVKNERRILSTKSPGDASWAYFSFFFMICSESGEPEKPGNMPKAQRSVYLKKVRNHAERLIELLSETRFDNDPFDYATLHFENQLSERPKADRDLLISSDHSDTQRVTYLFRDGETYRAQPDYPLFSLTHYLRQVVSWTKADSGFGRATDDHHAQKQAGKRGMKAVFIPRLKRQLDIRGVKMPYALIAEISNVVLQLGADDAPELDELSVRRHLERSSP